MHISPEEGIISQQPIEGINHGRSKKVRAKFKERERAVSSKAGLLTRDMYHRVRQHGSNQTSRRAR